MEQAKANIFSGEVEGQIMEAVKIYTKWTKEEENLIKKYYRRITNKEIAKRLDVNYDRLNSKIQSMKKNGKLHSVIRKTNKEKDLILAQMKKVESLDKKLKQGKKYKIKYTAGRNNKQGTNRFEGTLINKIDKYYIFRSVQGYIECFLKIDFLIGEYRIEEVS